MSQNHLRIEAIPLTWDSLSEFQCNAVEAVSKCLVDAIAAIPSKEHPVRFSSKLDRNRSTQLVIRERCASLCSAHTAHLLWSLSNCTELTVSLSI
jgi:hypothetical protein